MPNTKIDSAETTDMTNKVTDVTVNAAPSTTETEYQMDWNSLNGFYNEIPELQSVIDKKAMWTVGKGYTADSATKKLLSKIRGNGKDTWNTILYNAVKVYTIGGDFYGEIIKTKRGELRNLKPLNPGSIKIIADNRGMITRYELHSERGNPQINFSPEQIFHLPWNRSADSIHGISTILKLRDIINARNEAFTDLKVIFHRYVKPLMIISVDTDDETEIKAFKVKIDKAVENAENLIVPKETVDNIERVSIPKFSTLDPLPWLKYLVSFFIMAEGVPNVILGGNEDSTEATAKILYLAFQQMIEWNQLFIEEQLEAQLGIKLQLNFPASLEQDVSEGLAKEKKASNMEMGVDQNT